MVVLLDWQKTTSGAIGRSQIGDNSDAAALCFLNPGGGEILSVPEWICLTAEQSRSQAARGQSTTGLLCFDHELLA
jgi:hypothetical protein